MSTTRREALKQCLLIAVGTALLPACVQDKKKPAVVLKNFQLEDQEEQLLAEISETILPTTNTPGAKDTAILAFVLTMVDDLYTKEEQQQFLKGMRDFAKVARDKFGKPFQDTPSSQREALLSTLLTYPPHASAQDQTTPTAPTETTTYFLKTIKKLTIQAYTSSRYYLTKVRVYELVPGRFHGCVPVSLSRH